MTGSAVAASVAALSAAALVYALRWTMRTAGRLRARRRGARRIALDLGAVVSGSRAVRRREGRRADAALPEALDAVARALRSGVSMPVALAGAQPRRPALLARDWRVLAAEANDIGVIAAAERWGTRRSDSRAVRLAAAAVAVSASVGGPQAKAIDAVASTLRQRRALQAEVKALGSQARASAAVVALAPVAFAAIASGLEPTYLPFLLGTSTGLVMLVSGLVLQGCGLAWMARISRVEV